MTSQKQTKRIEIVVKTGRQPLEKQEKSAGLLEKLAGDFGARTATEDDTHGDDSLQNDQL